MKAGKRAIYSFILTLTVLVLGSSSMTPVAATGYSDPNFGSICLRDWKKTIFCDEFYGITLYKDQTQYAKWNRYPDDFDNAADYINLFWKNNLRLQVNPNATSNHYTDANISTAVINAVNPYLQFGMNTRAEARMKYSENITPDSTGDAKGSAGFLFWNYFQTEPDPENGVVAVTQEAFGFTWQDSESVPNAGLWVANIASGVPGQFFYVPNILPNFDMSEYHVYAIERREFSMTYYIDDVLIAEVPINQPGTLQVNNDHKFAIDTWVDNASYQFDPEIFSLTLNKQDVEENTYVDVDYMRVIRIQE